MSAAMGSIDYLRKCRKQKLLFFFLPLAILELIANIRNGSLSHYFVSLSALPPVILDQSFPYLSSKANSSSSYWNLLSHGAPNFVDFQLYDLLEEINIIISIDATQLEGIFPIILSVLEHTRHPIHFYLMSSPINGTELSNHWLKKYVSSCSRLHLEDKFSQFQLHVVPTHHNHNHTVHSQWHHLASAGNFARFYFPLLLPELDYALYFDTDTLILGDVAEIWNTLKASNATCVAVRREYRLSHGISERIGDMYFKRHRKAINMSSYGFNAGVWGVNFRRWRDFNYTEEAEFWMTTNDVEVLWKLGTQPVMLIVLYNDWVSLPSEWNAYSTREKDLTSAKLLHFKGTVKPWSTGRDYHAHERDVLWSHYTCPQHRLSISLDTHIPGWAGIAKNSLDPQWSRLIGASRSICISTTEDLHFHLNQLSSNCSLKNLLLEPGIYVGFFHIQCPYVTIIGKGPGVTIFGGIQISDAQYVRLHNFAIKGLNCSIDKPCEKGPDTISLQCDLAHIWLDHLDVDLSDKQAENFDLTKSTNYVTVSWCIFHHTKRTEQQQYSKHTIDRRYGSPVYITFVNNFWGFDVEPLVPYGNIHYINNWFSGSRVKGKQRYRTFEWISVILQQNLDWLKSTAILVEHCHFRKASNTIFIRSLSQRGDFVSRKNIGIKETFGKGDIRFPYQYKLSVLDKLGSQLLTPMCGVGNTCHLDYAGCKNS